MSMQIFGKLALGNLLARIASGGVDTDIKTGRSHFK